MKHRTVDYDVQEVQPGRWRWNIYPGNGKVQGPVKFRTRELAVEACMNADQRRDRAYKTRRSKSCLAEEQR
jgi:hypothetical protein